MNKIHVYLMYSSWAALLFLYIQEFPTQSGTVAVWLLRICIASVPLLVIYYLGVFTWGCYKHYQVRKNIALLWGTPAQQIENLKKQVRKMEGQRDDARTCSDRIEQRLNAEINHCLDLERELERERSGKEAA